MRQTADGLISTALPAGEGFFDALASVMFERCPRALATGDLSSVLILVPAFPIAAELRSAIRRVAPRPLLLPRFDTLRHWVHCAPDATLQKPLADSERLVLLHEALRQRGWFDDAALWGIASEMAGLFDELTTSVTGAVNTLAVDEAALAWQLQQAYALRASASLAFEARVLHESWRALATCGQPDSAAAYRLRLAAMGRLAEQDDAPSCPLLVLLDAAPEESLDPAEVEFLRRYGHAQGVLLFHPASRAACTMPLMATLAAAWPEATEAPLTSLSPLSPLFERAADLALRQPRSPLAGRLHLVPATGRELEVQAAVAQIGEWLSAGLIRIVLITEDRLSARRVRALLEREGILVSDETGGKLSTSRAAAAVDALIETAAGGAYYRDLLDLCKSPYFFPIARRARARRRYSRLKRRFVGPRSGPVCRASCAVCWKPITTKRKPSGWHCSSEYLMPPPSFFARNRRLWRAGSSVCTRRSPCWAHSNPCSRTPRARRCSTCSKHDVGNWTAAQRCLVSRPGATGSTASWKRPTSATAASAALSF